MTIEQFLEIKLGEQVEKQFGFFSENIRQDILDRMLQKENKKDKRKAKTQLMVHCQIL